MRGCANCGRFTDGERLCNACEKIADQQAEIEMLRDKITLMVEGDNLMRKMCRDVIAIADRALIERDVARNELNEIRNDGVRVGATNGSDVP